MLQKIVPETVLFLLAMGFASDFCELVNSEKYRNRVLCRSRLLGAFIRHLDPKWIVNEGEHMYPEFGSCRRDIVHWLDTRTNAILILANSFLLIELIIFGLSYTLDPHFVVLNLVAFCCVSRVKPTTKLKNELLTDVQMVLLYLYKWNLDDPVGCLEVVSTKIPALKTALLEVQRLKQRSQTRKSRRDKNGI